MKNLKVRLPMYFIGLFVMTIGIALSVKSNLGVSPVSSIPYTITCVWGIEMGKATILFHIVLVLIQILLLRKNLNWYNCRRFWLASYSVTLQLFVTTWYPFCQHLTILLSVS